MSFFGIFLMSLGFNAAGFNASLYASRQDISQPRSAGPGYPVSIRLSPIRQG